MANMVSVVDGESDTTRDAREVGAGGAFRPHAVKARTTASAVASAEMIVLRTRTVRRLSLDQGVLVQLLDQRRPRHAQPAGRLALVLARGIELLRDDRALERLDPRAQRMARSGIAVRRAARCRSAPWLRERSPKRQGQPII